MIFFQGDIRYSFDLFTAFYSNPVSLAGFYCSPVERRAKEASEAVQSTNERTAPLTFPPVGRNGRGGERGRGGGTGGGRRETGKRGWEREREPDVLIKRLIFIARQKREFNAHRRLMRRPTAAST